MSYRAQTVHQLLTEVDDVVNDIFNNKINANELSISENHVLQSRYAGLYGNHKMVHMDWSNPKR